VTDDPILVDSAVHAFENSTAQTRAWAERPSSGKRAGLESAPPVSRLSLREIDERLPALLRAHAFSDAPAVVHELRRDDEWTPVLRDAYSSAALNVDVSSMAMRVGRRLAYQTVVSAWGSAMNDAAVSMPVLRALSSTKIQRDPLRSYGEFLDRVEGLRREVVKNDSKWVFTIEVDQEALPSARAYRIRHPIIIKHGDTRECIVSTAYSPIAVSFPIESCAGFGPN
jgi:hypothetical protein